MREKRVYNTIGCNRCSVAIVGGAIGVQVSGEGYSESGNGEIINRCDMRMKSMNDENIDLCQDCVKAALDYVLAMCPNAKSEFISWVDQCET